jgi:DNA polymerase-3 subunit delta'
MYLFWDFSIFEKKKFMQFKDIVGQQEIKEQLIQTVKDGRISHAQLFYGPPGSGKLPLAIAYAQYISCTNRGEKDSCGECPSCKKYNKLIHPDLHFVFPVIKDKSSLPISDTYIKSWREVISESPYFTFAQWLDKLGSENKQASIYKDEAQQIIHKLNLKTYESLYKVMVIWLPEKMNITAANKLLKMIEEPPPQTVFLLVSEDRGAVLPTIFSRTVSVRIPAIENQDMMQSLMQNYDINETEAKAISRMSCGNLVEARNYFHASKALMENLETLRQWLAILVKKDIPACVDWSESLAGSGREKQKDFLIYALRFFRELLMFRTKQQDLNYLLKEEEDFVRKVAPYVNLKYIFKISDEIELAHYHIERNGMSKIILLDLSFKLIRLIKK